ncbi:MAG: hypothetical protein ACRCZO_14565, partial [Cetobacterium sp.]
RKMPFILVGRDRPLSYSFTCKQNFSICKTFQLANLFTSQAKYFDPQKRQQKREQNVWVWDENFSKCTRKNKGFQRFTRTANNSVINFFIFEP